jgi:DNA-binding transcriptional LysR family regulator
LERFSLKQIETFYCVARNGSFQSAAAQLHTTQPAVSSRIRELEQALGVQLFDRSGRQARLTARGRELVTHAQRLLAVAAAIREEIGGPEALVGLVRLGVADTIALTWLPELLNRFAEQLPGLGIELEIDLSINLLRLLMDRQIDIAFMVGPVPGPALASERLGSVELAWMAGAGLPLPAEPVLPAALAALPIITHSRGSHQHVMIQQWFRSRGLEPRRLSACSSLATIIHLTISGFGLSVLPVRAMTRQLEAGELRVVRSTDRLPSNEFVITYPVDGLETPVSLIASLATEIARSNPAFLPPP